MLVAPPAFAEAQVLLQRLLNHESLGAVQARALMEQWLSGTLPEALSGALLAALQSKGVSAQELAAMAQVLQEQAVAVEASDRREPLVDTCGTGGDGAETFNISTAVAFVTAAAGVKVAKHGNRSASGRVGSADVLEALGLNLTAPSDRIHAAVDEVGITFLFAPGWHPAMKAVAPLRKILGVRTVFNLLGPLVNPLRPTGQVIGVYNPGLLPTISGALAELGVRRAIVLHGREGLDEGGLADCTDLAIVREGQLSQQVVDPRDLGLTQAPTVALKGGSVEENADILKAVLQGKGTRAQQDAVLLNAALALEVGEQVDRLDQGISLARSVLASGAAWQKLTQLAAFLQS
ncbi:anthranilate phosphoribosyltransferase [Synechococcus elongatus]|uniref:Anthranilate phosphoribosyltransferase n=1 Tax=Synechococcus elongatus (strain ATCC 33912 / PCC 7942 / FACHB-805) TaxID=1140 RepID=TRPD_SYNE7|nr:anthranilate phosphoribosyltransferase [Synechococcus elongatus]Q31LB6.1 RecName: Full=Anthranilate phosphoribosyltransferase [Synechococcus elongatus PCC 7942 = FACHB-805]ABB58153.1 anthranilate phosphoribosyltransferase [Synechococcus elongatus PCC 7942 = FACHB-805]AJD57371.1 anthranilate phosphoribosyltransferase [Synechococcus elongatus UTEX 2973]MBD2586872.1 anthranilate phosphoribosyltransferase [Synechococcus elongatus FACHB-242]MBD2687943.1 anthranilate phosphoribosyltransferase [Sy